MSNQKTGSKSGNKPLKMLTVLVALLAFTLVVAACGNDNNENGGNHSGGHNPNVTFEMEDGGQITLELYPDFAPITVANFISLARSGFYDGLTFHRIIDGFMIQGGDPAGNGTGGPGYNIKGEFSANGHKNDIVHETGVISMARQGAYMGNPNYDTAGSQFFIMVADAPHLDGQYAAFGKVTDGMETVNAIAKTAIAADGQTPLVAPKISKVTVDTHGVQYDEPEKIKP